MLCSCSGITKTELTQEQNYKNTFFCNGIHNGERCILSRTSDAYGGCYNTWFTRPMLHAMSGLSDDELEDKLKDVDVSHSISIILDGEKTTIYDLHTFSTLIKGINDIKLKKLNQNLAQKCFSFCYNFQNLGD